MNRERSSFDALVASRRMTRAFLPEPIDPSLIDHCIDLATRAPSAGKTQGWHVVVLENSDTARYWDAAMTPEVRDQFGFPHLLDAPVVMVVLADPDAYVQRYAESDKSRTGLGTSIDAWSTPYWTVDASFAAMTILYALEDAGLGALFFATARPEEVRAALGIPANLQFIGTIATGRARLDGMAGRKGRSAERARRSAAQVIHRGSWGTATP